MLQCQQQQTATAADTHTQLEDNRTEIANEVVVAVAVNVAAVVAYYQTLLLLPATME